MADKLMLKKTIGKKPIKKKPPAPNSFNDYATAAAAAGYIAVFIDPHDGEVVVPFSEEIDAAKARRLPGKPHTPVVQVARFQYNPYCIWYVDPNGVLRQRCIP